jgi:UDP-N-acetylmuramate dehydrogenase
LEAICQADVPLRERTWYGLGGPARWFATPRDEAELATVLQRCSTHGIKWRVLGRGANLLVRDGGFDGVVIHLSGPAWETVRYEPADAPHGSDSPTAAGSPPGGGTGFQPVSHPSGNDPVLVHAAAGVDFPRLVRDTIERGLIGLENLAGIPGTVGGTVRMNAGGRHGCIAEYLRAARIASTDGHIRVCSRAELGFDYRRSNVDGGIVTEATFELHPGDRAPALERFRQIWNDKYAAQPPLSARSAGCVFKNPPGQAAGRLIDQAGLKGRRCRGAEISPRHANFIIAHPEATAQDVLDLIAVVRERVRETAGVELELEVEVW